MPDYDAVIVGAGLAGLNCARHLSRLGRRVRVFEADEAVGGRVRTDEVEGFHLDRGFQVLLTAYPEAREALDYSALDLRPFYDGALVRYGGAFHRVADPFRHPLHAPSTLFAPIGTFTDKLKVARLRGALRQGSLDALFEREEMTTVGALRRRWGFSSTIIDRFFRPFLGGILLDPDLEASSRMFEFVFRMFSEGHAALPAQGMQAIPQHLADQLPAGAVRLHTQVKAVKADAVVLDSGERVTAHSVVLATEAPETAELLGEEKPPPPRSAVCVYFAAERSPLPDPILILDGEGKGPVNNLSILTNVAPSYAANGKALVSAVVLGNPLKGDAGLEQAVQLQLADWFGSEVATWQHLRTYRVLYALPDQAPPFLSPPARPVRRRPGLYVCGDHVQTASIDGALAAGRRAALAVHADLNTA